MNQSNTLLLKLAAINGFIAVALGAFGAHGLKNILSTNLLQTWHTAVLYQSIHTLAILALAVLMSVKPDPSIKRSALLFQTGIVLFSGSLYLLAITGITKLGMITPIGGLVFLIAWASLFFIKRNR
jgi:uncharacterized membrane protein YgdD (TMEM256/DUF423 family)